MCCVAEDQRCRDDPICPVSSYTDTYSSTSGLVKQTSSVGHLFVIILWSNKQLLAAAKCVVYINFSIGLTWIEYV